MSFGLGCLIWDVFLCEESSDDSDLSPFSPHNPVTLKCLRSKPLTTKRLKRIISQIFNSEVYIIKQ